ncbi:MAG: hypothetical protein ACI3T9_01390 [Romboutsia timonensis]
MKASSLISDYIYNWLESALDYGISEYDFWNMTLAELIRAIESKKRSLKVQAKQKAQSDYILADMIGRSIARIYNSNNTIPDISYFYPNLFDSEEIKEKQQEQKDELSVIRFKQFADSFNRKYKEANK